MSSGPSVLTQPNNKSGLTMIELLVTIALVALMIILALFLWQNQVAKARDARRKSDLERLRVAFEEHYNDQECYPEETILNTCQGNQLQPYLNSVPCDPLTNEPYCYIHDTDNLSCGQNFRVLASFENVFDKIIEQLRCHGEGVYCGWEAECGADSDNAVNYNYGTADTGTGVFNPNAPPPPSPTPDPNSTPPPSPTPSSSPYMEGQLACDPTGICNNYEDPIGSGCPITYDQDNCNNECSNPANWCNN